MRAEQALLREDDIGKLGLALSGGGFRAALFHIGVLAELADRDLLRHVAVISTVSGGSIIGAYYYLKVKQLVEGRRRDGLTPSKRAFKVLVSEIERDFVEAVQRNMRVRAMTDSRINAKILGEDYSSSQHLGALFDRHFFGPITGGEVTRLRDLAIRDDDAPLSTEGTVDAPEFYRVPRLVLNATVLNTGRGWQFTDRFVGETEVAEHRDEEHRIPSLGRLRFDDPSLETRQRVRLEQLTLGEAVAASSCVPGLLDPFRIKGLFRGPDKRSFTVALVDGGVVDNQGVAALLDAECTHVICSDAAAPFRWQVAPDHRRAEILKRVNNVMMARLRLELLANLAESPKTSAVVHIADPAAAELFGEDGAAFAGHLAALRTDLDSFTEVESMALMFLGSRLAAARLDALGSPRADETEPPEGGAPEQAGWAFDRMEHALDDAPTRARILRQLEVGARPVFKVFRMGRRLPAAYLLVPLAAFGAGLVTLVTFFSPGDPVMWAALGIALGFGLLVASSRWVGEQLEQVALYRRVRRRLRRTLRPLGIYALMGALLSIMARVHLRVFDSLFLKYGRLPPGEEDRQAQPRR